MGEYFCIAFGISLIVIGSLLVGLGISGLPPLP